MVIGLIVFLSLSATILFFSRMKLVKKDSKLPEVVLPTIYNGELVLPKISPTQPDGSLTKLANDERLAVVSANMTAVSDQNKITALRIIGEVINSGQKVAAGVSPVIRLLDENGNLIAQKIARPSTGFEFHDLGPQETTLYDVTLDDPPKSDKLEIIFNITSSSQSAIFQPLKIAGRSMEIRTANINSNAATDQSTESAQESSGGQTVDYYIVSGKVVNPLGSAVTDVAIYAWARDEDNKVFAVGKTGFKNDLIDPGGGVDFRTILIPVRTDEKFASYEVAAWGREYRLTP